MAKKVRKAAKKTRKTSARAAKLQPHKLPPAQKKNFTLVGIHPVTGDQAICRYDPATGQWDDCD